MYDIIIINVPGTISNAVPAAPALLKASIQRSGFTCKTIDFNIRFQNQNLDIALENYFLTGINTEVHEKAVSLIKTYVAEIAKIETRYVGISVFTYQNKVATKIFCQELRKLQKIKIVIGGQGLSDGGLLGAQNFAKELMQQGLIDFYIKSEGENSIVNLLKNDLTASGINSDYFKQIDNLDEIAIPDYSDYDLDAYEDYLPVTGSRGCVRACSFCDVHDHWTYKVRKGESIAQEIIELYNKYGIKKFKFTDSLINGSLREFKKFCEIIAQFNLKYSANIGYSGQYIVRSSGQLDESYWKNLADSGAHHLTIGVETGSDAVRLHMNKKFTNADLDYTMEMLNKYSITCTFLMIFGYPTETQDDFQATLDMFKKYQKYANTIIKNVTFGSTLAILPGTPLFNNAKQFNIELDKHENNWIALDNENLTLSERIRRRQYAKEYVISLGYKIDNDIDVHYLEFLDKNMPVFDKRNKVKKIIKLKLNNEK